MAVTTAEASRTAGRRQYSPFSGVLVPALTPFTADLAVDRPALLDFCRWQLAEAPMGLPSSAPPAKPTRSPWPSGCPCWRS